jgi:hypothetical protein
MRRLWTIVVLLAILAGVSAPVFAALQFDEHACCRRAGAHQCSEHARLSGAGIAAKSVTCPYQTLKPTVSGPGAFMLTGPSSVAGVTATSSTVLLAVQSKATQSFKTAVLDRGPPLA